MGEHCFPKGQESVLLCYLQPSDTTKRNVEDVKDNPRPEALTNSLKKHTVLWGFFSPPPHWSSYTLKFKSDGKPSDGRLKAVISRLTRR